MSKALQWVIGIGVVLMVAAFVFSSVAPFFLPRVGLVRAPITAAPNGRFAPTMPFGPGFMFGLGRAGLRPPFFGLFGVLACVWPLLLIGLVVWGISALTQRPAPMRAAPPAIPMPPAPVSQAACSNCGQPLQADWRHCPNCGQAVAQ